VCNGYELPIPHEKNGSLKPVTYDEALSPAIPYSAFSNESSTLQDHLFKTIFLKNPLLINENEIRLAIDRESLSEGKYFLHRKSAYKSVFFGEKMTPENRRLVTRLLSGSGYENVKYYEAFSVKSSYKIDVKFLYDQNFVSANS